MHHRKSPPASSRQTFQRYTFQCVMVFVAVHTCMTSNGILPILRIPNRQNLQPELYRTEFSVQKIPACEQLLVFRFRSSICFFFGFIRANENKRIHDFISQMRLPDFLIFQNYLASSAFTVSRRFFSSISFWMDSMKLSTLLAPSSPAKRLRTETVFSSSSFCPTTSMYGIF